MDNHIQHGTARPTGNVQVQRTRHLGDLRGDIKPVSFLWRLRNMVQNRHRELPAAVATRLLGRVSGFLTVQSKLSGVVYRPDFSRLAPEQVARVRQMLAENFNPLELTRYFGGDVTVYGVMSRRLVTDNGVGYLVDALQNLTEPENFKYHGFGTGTNAEAQADSTLQTELTTQYVVDNTRPTGSQTETSANIYRSVGTLSPDSGGTIAVTEHGLFSAASAGTLLDRSKFAAVNLVAGSDSLQTTYDLTLTAGG